ISPKDLQSAAAMDLQSNGAFSFGDFVIGNVHHLFTVQPGRDLPAYYTDFHAVPVTIFQEFILFWVGLNQPAPAVRLIDPSGVMTWRSYLYLPAGHFGSLKRGADKDPAVTILLLFELSSQLKIFVEILRT